jgi:hypothetical protein
VALAFPLFSEAVHHRGIARIVSPEDPNPALTRSPISQETHAYPAAIEATKADYLDKESYPDKTN